MVNTENNKIILNFSSTDNGGAGGAAYQFHSNLIKANYESFLFVARKTKNTEKLYQLRSNITYKLQAKNVQIKNYLNFTNKDYFFLNSELKFSFDKKKLFQITKNKKISYIVIHSVPNFLDYNDILDLKNYFNCKVFFRLYDMQNYTGGCSYSLGCNNFKKNCQECPGLNYKFLRLKNYYNFLKKKNIIRKIKPKILSSSHFEMKRSKQSTLFKNFSHYHLPLGFNSKIFRPINKIKKKDKTIILFGSSDLEAKRKGLIYFIEAIKNIKFKSKLKIILIGSNKKYFKDLKIETKFLKYVKNFRQLNYVLNKAHFCAIPSIDETGPSILNMSMMASTPCITFNIGDAFKHVVNKVSGFKCKNKNIKQFGKNVELSIRMKQNEFDKMRMKCRRVALKNFTDQVQILKIKKIFR